MLALAISALALAAPPPAPDPVALAAVCVALRAQAPGDLTLLALGCHPDLPPLPAGQRPCKLTAPQVDPVTLGFDDRGRLTEATHWLDAGGQEFPHTVRYAYGEPGLLAVQGTNTEATAHREGGRLILAEPSFEARQRTETIYEVLTAGFIGERALVDGASRELIARWVGTRQPGLQVATPHDPGLHPEVSLSWDTQGRPERLRLVTSSGARESRFAWGDQGQLLGLSRVSGLAMSFEALYACTPAP